MPALFGPSTMYCPMAYEETSYASAKAIPIQVFLMSDGFLL